MSVFAKPITRFLAPFMSNLDIIEGFHAAAASDTLSESEGLGKQLGEWGARLPKQGVGTNITNRLVWRAGLFSANAYRQVKCTGIYLERDQ